MLENIEQITKINNSIDNWKNNIDPFPLELKPISDSPIETGLRLDLTPEAKEYLNEVLSNKLESLKISVEEIKEISTQIFDSMQENINDVSEKLGDKTPNFDTKAILKSAGVSAGIGGVIGATGGGIGAVPGAVIGGVSGAAGEMSRQIAIHNGASELVGTGIQTATEMVTGAAIVKLAGTTVGKSLLTHSDNMTDVVKNSKVGGFASDKVDDVAIKTKDTLVGKIKDVNPNISEGRLSLLKGEISETAMDAYYKNSGWTKIEGEVGRNGIDGLYFKRDGNSMKVLLSESKYNTSQLGETLFGKQMSQQWIEKKLDNLIKAFPDNTDYRTIKQLVENGQYRSRLWKLNEVDGNLQINVTKILPNGHNNIDISNLNGAENLKINNFQNINLANPTDKYSQKIANMYNQSVDDVLKNSKYI